MGWLGEELQKKAFAEYTEMLTMMTVYSFIEASTLKRGGFSKDVVKIINN